MIENDAVYAQEFASDPEHETEMVHANWWEYFSGYRLKQWQKELKEISEETGISLDDVCRYLGLNYKKDVGFFAKLPKKRSTYIGIGMAMRQPLDKINSWITGYGMKRALDIRHIRDDLAWIWLILVNFADQASGRNYYKEYDSCRRAAFETYCRNWTEELGPDEDTEQMMRQLQEVPFEGGYESLCAYVTDHLEAFKRVFAQPRIMLSQYVDMILEHMDSRVLSVNRRSLSSLRGYLDDSMINYLSGDPETIHVVDRRSGRRSMNTKHVPKNRKAHISMALALGMTREEVDEYLQLMGFSLLDAVDQTECILINLLTKWECTHELQRRLKDKVLAGKDVLELTKEEAGQAVHDMLRLRQDLNAEFIRSGLISPYMNS